MIVDTDGVTGKLQRIAEKKKKKGKLRKLRKGWRLWKHVYFHVFWLLSEITCLGKIISFSVFCVSRIKRTKRHHMKTWRNWKGLDYLWEIQSFSIYFYKRIWKLFWEMEEKKGGSTLFFMCLLCVAKFNLRDIYLICIC